jgi:ATP-dependent RNA helicase RhlE
MNESFGALGVSDDVVAALARSGITEPFAIQRLCIPPALAGEDILAKSPTGSGKTLAFGVPLVMRADAQAPTPGAVVLSPTRELAQQIARDLEPLGKAEGVAVAVAFGGARLSTQARAAAAAQILVATPGRLIDLVERRLVDLRHVRRLVLDEADRMVDMGFLPQVDRIVRRLPQERQTLFFSATLDGEVLHIARRFTHDPRRIDASELATVELGEVRHRFVAVEPHEKQAKLVELLAAAGGPALVFCETRHGCERLARRLTAAGVRCEAIHGDRAQAERGRALRRFTAGEVPVLVATNVAARGIDVSGIALVVNYDTPEQAEDYTHRVGRTGRAGARGEAVTLVSQSDHADVSRIARRLELGEELRSSGLKVAPPRLVYTSRRSGGRGRRRW